MSELPFKFIFYPEQPDEKIINGYTEIVTSKKLDFEGLKAIATEITAKEFEKGLDSLLPLVSRKINKISITVNLRKNNYHSFYASYSPHLSNPEGNFSEPFFSVSNDMLNESLSLYDVDILSEHNEFIWKHEIIHWIDSNLKQLNEETIVRQIKCGGSRFLGLMFSYRKEGIAGIYETLSFRNYITSIKSAKEAFVRDANESLKKTWNSKYTIDTIKEKTLYEIGPWMIFHVLSCPEYPNNFSGIEEVLRKLKNEEPFEQSEILSLLKRAMEIDNFNFIKYLTKPGIDGQTFITPEQMRIIRKKMGKIPNSREDIKYYMKIKPEESGSIISIIEFYNWFGG